MNGDNNLNGGTVPSLAEYLIQKDEAFNFVNSVIAQSSKNNLPEDEKGYLLIRLATGLMENFQNALLNAIPEEQFAKLEALPETATAEEMAQIITESGVDVRAIFEDVKVKFKAVFDKAEAEETV